MRSFSLSRRTEQRKAVYVFRNPCNGLVKVGEGTPEERLRDGSTWIPNLEVCAVVWFENKTASRAVEQAVHSHLRRYRKWEDREWFDCSPETAIKAIDYVSDWSSITLLAHRSIMEAVHWVKRAVWFVGQVVIAGLAMVGAAAVFQLASDDGDVVEMPSAPSWCVENPFLACGVGP